MSKITICLILYKYGAAKVTNGCDAIYISEYEKVFISGAGTGERATGPNKQNNRACKSSSITAVKKVRENRHRHRSSNGYMVLTKKLTTKSSLKRFGLILPTCRAWSNGLFCRD